MPVGYLICHMHKGFLLGCFSAQAKRQKLMAALEDLYGGAEHLEQAVAQNDRSVLSTGTPEWRRLWLVM